MISIITNNKFGFCLHYCFLIFIVIALKESMIIVGNVSNSYVDL